VSELRSLRIQDQIQREVADMILRGEIKDPRVNSFLSVTRVVAARDYSSAHVFVSSFEDEEKLLNAVRGLNSAAPYIQGIIGRKLRIRVTPRLIFEADTGIREGFEITQKIKSL
jgi:ribosome-binding factor A